jgi:hypothetical protein
LIVNQIGLAVPRKEEAFNSQQLSLLNELVADNIVALGELLELSTQKVAQD